MLFSAQHRSRAALQLERLRAQSSRGSWTPSLTAGDPLRGGLQLRPRGQPYPDLAQSIHLGLVRTKGYDFSTASAQSNGNNVTVPLGFTLYGLTNAEQIRDLVLRQRLGERDRRGVPHGVGERQFHGPSNLHRGGGLGQYRLTKHNHCLRKGFLQGRHASMLRSFLLELRHLSLDNPGIDPVAPHLIVGTL